MIEASDMRVPRGPATVYLVGAGPGDPGLITARGRDLLARADAVLYDWLAGEGLLSYVPERAERVFVGKRGHAEHLSQGDVNTLLVETARRIGRGGGSTVVRLKGGDPFVFGRGGEEASALARAGVPYQVVPGVTSGVAVPAYAGIPVTHRGLASSVTFVTGHEASGKSASALNWDALAALASAGGTLCFYMGMSEMASIANNLERSGLPPETPAAVIQWGTTERQRTLVAPVGRLAAEVRQRGLGAPAIIVVGQVSRLDEALDWRSARPLSGVTIVVTRPKTQAGALSQPLGELGANVIEFPVIEIAPPDDFAPLDGAISNLARYQWVVFTSANGVDAFFGRLGGDARRLGGAMVAAIGPSTARRLRRYGIVADVVPGEYRAEAVFSALEERGVSGRVLLPRAQVARPALPDLLREAGVPVDVVPAYKTALPRDCDPDRLAGAIRSGEADAIAFTSPSTVRNTVALLGGQARLLGRVGRYSIGPVTSEALREAGLPPTAEAVEYTAEGLVRCITRDVLHGRSASDGKDT